MIRKRWLLAAVSAFLCAVLLSLWQRGVLFQEGNPVRVGLAALRLEMGADELVQFSEQPVKYLLLAKTGNTPFIQMMAGRGWRFEEQMGGGLLFAKEGERLVATTRMWTRRYHVIRLGTR